MASFEEIEFLVFNSFADLYANGGFDDLIEILENDALLYKEFWDNDADGLSTLPIVIDMNNRVATLDAFKKLHYARNLLQPDWSEVELAENLELFYLETEGRSLFHGAGNLKLVSYTGHFEYILVPKPGGFDILDNRHDAYESRLMGTYNFAGFGDSSGHNLLDVLPWLVWGNSPSDPSDFDQRKNSSVGFSIFIDQSIEIVASSFFAEVFGWLQQSEYQVPFDALPPSATIDGTDLNDTISGTASIDIINGLEGDDFLTGGASADLLIGGPGSDTADYSSSPEAVLVSLQAGRGYHGDASDWHLPDEYESVENVRGSHFSDLIFGDDSANIIEGLFGHDTLAGGDGNDILRGGPGNDILWGGNGTDVLSGGDDNDTLHNTGGGTMRGDAGEDTINLSSMLVDATLIDGGNGVDTAHITGNGFYGRNGVLRASGGILGAESTIPAITEYLEGLASGSEQYVLMNRVRNSNSGIRVFFENVESINIDGDEGDDLIVYFNGSNYSGGSGTDRFAADWRDQSTAIEWRLDTAPDTTLANGITVAGFESISLLLGSGNDTVYGLGRSDYLDGGAGADTLAGGAGNDILHGGSNIDTAVVSGNRASYTIIQTSTGVFQISGRDGTDVLNTIEYLQFDDELLRLLPGAGVSVNFETADPSVYQASMDNIRDFDGNDVGGQGGWLRIGSADVNGDGDVDQILVNLTIGRFATVGTTDDGLVYYDDHAWAGETRVAGIYIDPLVASGQVEAGSGSDSQTRFQNDLEIENINRVLGADDYDGDGLQEVYFALTDGTAYLHAYMHADGNIQYANYQSQQEVIDFLTANGFDSSTWADWFPSGQESGTTPDAKGAPVMETLTSSSIPERIQNYAEDAWSTGVAEPTDFALAQFQFIETFA